MKKYNIKTKEKARQCAITWQHWQSKRTLSYKDIAEWAEYFRVLGKRFNLIRDFKENGII
jgi:hypothetical protein